MGCPFDKTRVRRVSSRVTLAKPFRRRRLKVGTVLTVRVTAPGATGLAVRFKMRSNRAPTKTKRRIAASPVVDPAPPVLRSPRYPAFAYVACSDGAGG
jgi:hypothetical protein